jgi:hypothetical protein
MVGLLRLFRAFWNSGNSGYWFWYGNVIATIFHTTVLIAATNWGVLGITGKDIVEWIEIALKKT